MTEINTNVQAGQQTRQQQQAQRPAGSRRDQPTRASANRLPGLASGLNTQGTIETIVQVERRRLEPVQDQRADTLRELESFGLINTSLEKINTTIGTLKGAAVWEGKIVESSDEGIVTATATRGAKPGKHTLVVDRLALNHQIASQGYANQDDQVGTGRLVFTVGDGSPNIIVIDESNNTLTGVKDAINFATDQVNATVVKTGNKLKPYQLVLTSQKTGSEGRIEIEVNLQGGEPPNFKPSVEDPSPWRGVGKPTAAGKIEPITGTGASTSIVRVVGEYTGEDDNSFTFTAVQTGVVGGDRQLQVRWTDKTGRSGLLNLDKLNYAPGEPIEFVDGLALIFSEGEVIVNDQFSFNTRAQRSDLAWWVAPEARPAATSVPTAWRRQLTEEFGAPIVEGDYSGGEDQQFTLSVMGSGQVGRAPGLTVSWTAEETGETGILNVGQGYEPGTPLAITDGMTLTLKPGVLNDGQVATFEVEARIPQNQWWRFDTAQDLPSKIRNVTNWTLPEAELPEEGGFMPALPEQLGPRVSTVPVQVGGVYSGDEAKVYTFTALADGAVGTTRDLRIQWEDDKGNVGELLVGEGYQPGTPLPFDAGLTVAFGAGRVFESDTFTTRTRTATIQPPQDALIHFGATELGGGLEISSPTNELEGVIDGVRLNLVSAANKPVTITIRGDTEQATESVKSFVDQFNELAALITELTKFDKETNIAGPLLGDRDVIEIRNRMSEMLVDPVAGLPPKFNMLLSLGIAFDDNGFLTVDQSTLTGKINEDFGSVADLFRNKGESNNPNVAFVGMTEETHINTEGYQVDVTRPATQGHYLSPALAEPVRLDASNNSFIVSVDGRQSENVELPVGQFTVTQYARVLQDAITNDKVIGQRGVRVIADGGQIKVLSGRFGAQSAIGFLPGSEARNLSPGLEGGSSEIGQDISGTIDGEVAEGNGQLLRAPDKGGKAVGLRLFVKLNESQLNPNGPEGLVVVTKGVASRLSSYLNQLVNPLTGQMRRITQNLRDRVNNLDQQLGRMEDRIDAKRKRLQEKFDRMESKMSTLRSQQSFMQGQLANMGGGNLLASLPR